MMSELCGCFASVFVADLREVGAPCGVLGPAWPEERPGVVEQLLGGSVGFLRHRSHDHLLGRPPVRTPPTANDQLREAVCRLLQLRASVFLVVPHHRKEDKCLQGIANATITGTTSHTTCTYLERFTVFFCSHPDSPSV